MAITGFSSVVAYQIKFVQNPMDANAHMHMNDIYQDISFQITNVSSRTKRH